MTQEQSPLPSYIPSKKELAGKRIGHLNTLRALQASHPKGLMGKRFYDRRPDVAASKTRKEHWKQIHSDDRFIQALFFYIGPPGHLLWNLRLPLSLVMLAVFLNLLYYILSEIFSDLPRIDKERELEHLYGLGTFAVSLLLAMRINRTYERWWAARQSFGAVSSNTTQAAQLIAVWIEDEAFVQKFVNCMIVYHYSVMMQLLAMPVLPAQAMELLSPEERAVYSSSKKCRQLASLQAHELLRNANLDMERFMTIEQLLVQAAREGGACARIKFQAMPYSVSIVCTGFVFIWLLFLTIGLFGYNNVPDASARSIILAVFRTLFTTVGFFFVALLLLSCDEIANQLEDPFYQLPLADIAKVSAGHMQRTVKELRALREAKAKEEARIAQETESDLAANER